jgi:hypothetical protein
MSVPVFNILGGLVLFYCLAFTYANNNIEWGRAGPQSELCNYRKPPSEFLLSIEPTKRFSCELHFFIGAEFRPI